LMFVAILVGGIVIFKKSKKDDDEKTDKVDKDNGDDGENNAPGKADDEIINNTVYLAEELDLNLDIP
jgi:hypothetical protein